MSANETEHLFFSLENLHRKGNFVMPDYQMIYDRLTAPGSKANLFCFWLKCRMNVLPVISTQYCLHFKRFVKKNYGSEPVSTVVELIPVRKSILPGLATIWKYLLIRPPVKSEKSIFCHDYRCTQHYLCISGRWNLHKNFRVLAFSSRVIIAFFHIICYDV